tara:strand:- start:997 stop:1461 length:465 start_codon:yes stop_codon:yes gene_type:complete
MEYFLNIFKSKNIEGHIPLDKRRAIDASFNALGNSNDNDILALKELVLEPTDSEKHEKSRLVQNSVYFEKRYRDLKEITKVIMFGTFIFVILTVLSSRGFLPSFFGSYIIPIFVGCFLFYLVFRYFDVAMRNQINYDDYNFNIPDFKNRVNKDV